MASGEVVIPPPMRHPQSFAVAPRLSPDGEHGLVFGNLHRLHPDTSKMGFLSRDGRVFRKETYDGRLSIITEDQVRKCGCMKYAVKFTSGELSSADGVGFILSSRLPPTKNIQKIVSIFMNRAGRICVRANSTVTRFGVEVRPVQVSDWVSVTIDLDKQLAHFAVHPADGSPVSAAGFDFGAALACLRASDPDLRIGSCGYFACVVKNKGVALKLGS
uniref:Uncharacterized protein n=1 Tax=Zooxanthella nutricula TaxID=1333877 RepID=A0A7S2M5M5_9DINO